LSISAAPTSVTRVCSVCGTSYLQGTAHACLSGNAAIADGDDLLGAILGERYRILSLLTKGGMGVIYKAQHTVLDKPLAIKIMLQAQDDAARQRFLQEAKLASLVRHPNIVDIVDFGVLTSKQPYLVMELLVGKTLADVIMEGPLPAARVCHIAAQIARGLHSVHQKGIIHRDLKPATGAAARPLAAAPSAATPSGQAAAGFCGTALPRRRVGAVAAVRRRAASWRQLAGQPWCLAFSVAASSCG
jgi:hypothetical protein